MRTSFTIIEPTMVSRCGQLDAWNKFVVVLDEMMRDIDAIGRSEEIRVRALHFDENLLYRMEFGFPLNISIRCLDSSNETVDAIRARLYINKKTLGALASVDDAPREESSGDIDTVVRWLSNTIRKHLQNHFSAIPS